MNKNRDNISVCMATYNGAKFIQEQLDYILKQLNELDEVIIVDDCSKDETVNIIERYEDPRIVLIRNKINKGVNKNFEIAIGKAQYDYIFLADQDDVWADHRVEKMIKALQIEDVELVSGNSECISVVGDKIEWNIGKLFEVDSDKRWRNITRIFTGKAYYYGCAMAFKRSLLKVAHPFPEYIESHDLWLAMVANIKKTNFHLEDIVLLRRIHGNNASIVQRTYGEKIKSRWIFLLSLFEIYKKI